MIKQWIDGKFEETETDYKIAGQNWLNFMVKQF